MFQTVGLFMLMRLVFILTLFGSAFLSFSIQPLLGKMMLPIVGGAPAGWIIAMAFFQLALLGGYALSHGLQRVSPLVHGLVLLALYAVGMTFLPSHIAPDTDIQGHLSMAVLGLLAKTILLPFIALTSTTSALLRIFSHTDEPTAKDPYYLFIASNAGSLIGLFIYPIVLEPFFDLSLMSRLWFFVYSAVTLFVVLCLMLARRNPDTRDHAIDHHTGNRTGITGKTIFSWLCLAFVPCCLSMSLTTMLTTDLGNFPLIWTLPLGLYLLSFIVAYARKPLVSLDTVHFLHIAAAAVIFILISMNTLTAMRDIGSLAISIVTVCALFFLICWSCHQTLAAERPAARNLTFYYLIIALGGALAGILNAFIIPVTLNSVMEFPLSVGLSLCLPMIWNKRLLPVTVRRQNILFGLMAILATAIIFACYYSYQTHGLTSRTIEMTAKVILYICLFSLMLKPRFLALLVIPVTFYYVMTSVIGTEIIRERNFFGSMIVVQNDTPLYSLRVLRHGNTVHGMAHYKPDGTPTLDMNVGYYVPGGPLQETYDIANPKHIAILGLGTGQLACYSKQSQMTFFEIDPDMVRVAREHFPYLTACPPQNIILGDARIELAKDTQTYDMLVLDVFSSDGIPTHILTLDAIRMYPQHLKKDGMLLFHISNRYLALAPQIAASVEQLGLNAYTKLYTPDRRVHPLAMGSQWVAVPLDPATGAKFTAKGWQRVEKGATRAWTDERSSMLTAIRPIAVKISGQADLVNP